MSPTAVKPNPHDAKTRGRPWLTALPAVVLVLAIYVWFASIGTLTVWPSNSTYYDKLATAFAHGQLWLEVKPDASLLALPNPYDPEARKGLPFLSDASLYQGRYYLYFGPVPALILVVAKIFHPAEIADQYLVFAFTSGVFLVMALFAIRIWKRFVPQTAPWIVGSSIAAVGLMSPFAWILGSQAAVHDAAIAAGQFFFLAGLYAAFLALDGESLSVSKAILAGALWALALGSRITQIVPIAVLLALVGARLVWDRGRTREAASMPIKIIVAFVAPLVAGITALGWYNGARFGSVLETGVSYQLALLYLQAHGREIFSVKYLVQNLYNYVLMPAKLRFNFPYIWPRMGIRSSILPGFPLPSLYFAENITGLLFTAPFLLFGLASAAGQRRATDDTSASQQMLRWLVAALAGALLAGLVLFLAFFWASERYLLDFIPAALLLGLIGFWRLLDSSRDRPRMRATILFAGMLLMLVSVVISTLLAIALNADGFRQLNPVLWQQLNNVFRP